MSLISLTISLIAGSYGLYDTFVVKKQKERDEAISDVRAAVKRLTEINAMSITAFMNKPEAGMYISQSSNPEKIALLALSDKIISQTEKKGIVNQIDAGTFFLLASEQLNFGNALLANKYANYSVLSSGGNKAIEAEALRIEARSKFAPSSIQDREEGRRIYNKARDMVRNFSSLVSPQVEINIVSDLMVSEANFGDCEKAKDAAKEIVSIAQNGGISQKTLSVFFQPMKANSLKTSQCIGEIL